LFYTGISKFLTINLSKRQINLILVYKRSMPGTFLLLLFEMGSCYVAQTSLELKILLPHLPKGLEIQHTWLCFLTGNAVQESIFTWRMHTLRETLRVLKQLKSLSSTIIQIESKPRHLYYFMACTTWGFMVMSKYVFLIFGLNF
jgi:hypothetical protein